MANFRLGLSYGHGHKGTKATSCHPLTDGIPVRGGDVWQNTSNLFENAGNNGNYWSSTPHSNGTNAYNLNFNGTSNINPSNNNNRNAGFSVRCPSCARSPKIKIYAFLTCKVII